MVTIIYIDIKYKHTTTKTIIGGDKEITKTISLHNADITILYGINFLVGF